MASDNRHGALWRLWIGFWRSLGVGVYEDKRWDKDGPNG